jgi:hypothetical protein
MRLSIALASAALGVVLPQVAAAETPPRVAVIPQLAVNVDERRVQALGEELAETLHHRLVVDAIGGIDVARRLPEDGLPDDCLVQPKCVADLGVRLDADQLIFVVLVQVGQDIQIDATWVDVASGRSVARPRLVLAAEARAGTVFGEAATRLLPDAEVRSRTVVVQTGRGPRRMTTPAWITGGVGALFLATSVGLAISTRSTYQRCEDSQACSQSELDGMERRALFADLSFGVALGAGVATGVLWWLSGDGENAIGVTPTADGAGVTWGGRF